MNEIDFPPFPAMGARGPLVCKAVCFYLAIVDELPFGQVSVLSEHVQTCQECAAEFRVLQGATRLVASLPESVPAAHVDQAILAAIQKQGETARASVQLHTKKYATTGPLVRQLPTRKKASRRWPGALAVAAVLLVLVLAGIFLRGLIFPSGSAQAFRLPDNLSWNGYVLHYTQTLSDSKGQQYQVEVYQDLGTNQMHIESSMQGQFDVVVVTDAQTMVGEDMMHHVAQMGNGVEPWAVDGSMFDLAHLRQSLTSRQMTYLGKETFQGQVVYLVQVGSGQVLLLNMHYFPVTVLHNFTTSGTGAPLYTTFTLMQSIQVSDSMWNMEVPPGFHMGQLPAKS
jgi:hypothetical protein